jgi:hypothetical protein
MIETRLGHALLQTVLTIRSSISWRTLTQIPSVRVEARPVIQTRTGHTLVDVQLAQPAHVARVSTLACEIVKVVVAYPSVPARFRFALVLVEFAFEPFETRRTETLDVSAVLEASGAVRARIVLALLVHDHLLFAVFPREIRGTPADVLSCIVRVAGGAVFANRGSLVAGDPQVDLAVLAGIARQARASVAVLAVVASALAHAGLRYARVVAHQVLFRDTAIFRDGTLFESNVVVV